MYSVLRLNKMKMKKTNNFGVILYFYINNIINRIQECFCTLARLFLLNNFLNLRNLLNNCCPLLGTLFVSVTPHEIRGRCIKEIESEFTETWLRMKVEVSSSCLEVSHVTLLLSVLATELSQLVRSELVDNNWNWFVDGEWIADAWIFD